MRKIFLMLLMLAMFCLVFLGCSPEKEEEGSAEQTQIETAQTDGDASSETLESAESSQTEESDADGEGWIPGFYQ